MSPLRLPPLPAETRRLCGRLAVETLRAEGWRLRIELLAEARRRLAAGEPPASIDAELHHRICSCTRAARAEG